jgi:hypothetical protein
VSGPVYFDFNEEMDQVAIFLNADADLLSDQLDLKIKQMMAAGMGQSDIIGVLRKDLYGGGPLFSGFTSTFKRHVFPVIDNAGQRAVIRSNQTAPRWEWVTTSADPCDDCRPRHGKVMTYAEWQSAGLPRSGFSVCGEHCKCTLLPPGQVGPAVQEAPVEIPTLAQARADFQARMTTDPALKARMAEYRASLKRSK